MKFINYDNIPSYLNKTVINTLIFNNLEYGNFQEYNYILLSIPRLNVKNEEIVPNILTQTKKNANIKNILNIPNLILNKIIICLNKNTLDTIIIKDKNFKLNDYKSILNYLILYNNNLQYDLGIYKNLLFTIRKKITRINFLNSYNYIEYIDKIIEYLYYYNNLIDKTNNISNYFSDKNELNIELNNILNNNIKYINDLNDNLYQTRHSCMQRIQYMESSISRLLTYVATIFLPLSFLIGFISLPIKNIPFRNNNNFIYYLLFIIIIYIIIILATFYTDIKFIISDL